MEWRHSAVVGALFFLIGHGTLHWAEQSVPSGLSALLVATEPVWIAILLALTGAARLRPPTIGPRERDIDARSPRRTEALIKTAAGKSE